ncbi:MAG: hypothetical protein ABSD20_07485 [Terriglobales bacterium]|jgi:hypothetical protein
MRKSVTFHSLGSLFVATGLFGIGLSSAFAQGPNDAALVAAFGGRPPRACPTITRHPSKDEAAILVQCTMEGPFGTIENLLTNVKVQITGSRRFDPAKDTMEPKIDSQGTIYTIKGNAQAYTCSNKEGLPPNKNCVVGQFVDATGTCWKTTDAGGYRCKFESPSIGFMPMQPPPATF